MAVAGILCGYAQLLTVLVYFIQVLWNIINMKMFELKTISPCNTFMECQDTIICSEIYLSILLKQYHYWIIGCSIGIFRMSWSCWQHLMRFPIFLIHSALNNTSRAHLLSQGLPTNSCWRRTAYEAAQVLECCCKWA